MTPRCVETLHARGILTVGIPRTIEPLTPSPPQEEVHQMLHQPGLHRKRTPHQVHSGLRVWLQPTGGRKFY